MQIESINLDTPEGPVINVMGADLMDGTPVYDIKPYLKYSDSHPDSVCGYVDGLKDDRLDVIIPPHLSASIPDATRLAALEEVLSLDPRPSYHSDPDREYGLSFAGYNIKFTVKDNALTVNDISCL